MLHAHIAQITANNLVILEEQETNESAALFTAFPLENLMSIANFLNPIEEKAANRFFMNKEVIALVQENPEEDTEREAAEDVTAILITQIYSKVN
jgi:hypothetical protein